MFARRRHTRLQARGERLFEELSAGERLSPSWTADRVTTIALAAVVHLVTVLVFALAVAIIVWSWPGVPGLLVGCLVAMFGVLLRPRLGRLSKRRPVLRRDSAPAVFELTDRIVGVIGGRAPDVVLVDSAVNASWSVVGLRRRRVLTIGWPLAVAMPPNGLVALVGHEVGHEINGDVTHGLVVRSAMRALVEWQLVFASPARQVRGSIDLAARVTGWIICLVPRAWLRAMRGRALRSSQRAEYLADALATQAAGTAACIELFETLLLGGSIAFALERAARTNDDNAASVLRRHLDSIPPTEKERVRRVAARRFHRADDTHPPTHHRLKLIEGRGTSTAQVTVSAAEADRMVKDVLRCGEATRLWRLEERRRRRRSLVRH